MQLWYSDNFGVDWNLVKEYVKSYFLDTSTMVTTLYVEYETPGKANIVVSSPLPMTGATQTVITNVEDFELREDFMLATRRRNLNETGSDDLDLLVSYKRGAFVTAQFPSQMKRRDYHIVDISDDQLLVCVNHDQSLTNLYIANVPHPVLGVRFSLSLQKVLFLLHFISLVHSYHFINITIISVYSSI